MLSVCGDPENWEAESSGQCSLKEANLIGGYSGEVAAGPDGRVACQ